MTSNVKSASSSAIKAEIKRYDSLQSAINRLFKQFERVENQTLRSGLKVYLHSIQAVALQFDRKLTLEDCSKIVKKWLHYAPE